MNILLTGASGLLGQRILARLLDDPTIGKVWAVDQKPGLLRHPKIQHDSLDISKPWPKPPFKLGAVLHFAFALNPMKDLEREKEINLQGTRQFVAFLEENAIPWAQTISSGTAYGALEDNPSQLRESDPLRAEAKFPYAYHKRVMEEELWSWQSDKPETKLSVLRPCILMGPEVDNYISRTLGNKLPPAVMGENPPMQFVHVEDVARACLHLLAKRLTGAFNVAGEDTLSYLDALEEARGIPLKVPKSLIQPMSKFFWDRGILEGPPGMADFLTYSWVMDTRKLRKSGFHFLYSSSDALKSWIGAQLRWDRRPILGKGF